MNITLEICGASSHVEFGHLTSSELVEVHNEHKENPVDIDEIFKLSGGHFAHEACNISFNEENEFKGYDVRGLDNDTDEEFNIDLGETTLERTEYLTDEGIERGEIRYYKVVDCEGDTLTITIDNESDEPFDQTKLKIQYLEYNFDGWIEKYGKIVTGATYDNEECDADPGGASDKYKTVQIQAYGGDIDCDSDEATLAMSLRDHDDRSNGGYLDLQLVLEQDNGETKWNWDGMEEYLKSKGNSNSSPPTN